jgi:hypothetical protein
MRPLLAVAMVAVLCSLMAAYPLTVYAKDPSPPKDTTAGSSELFEAEHADTLLPYDLEIVATPKFDDLINRGYVRIPASFKLGLPVDWDVAIIPTFLVNNPGRREHRAGVSDVTFGAKYKWKQWLKSQVSAATALAVTIPTGDHPDVSGEYTHFKPKLIFTKKITLPEMVQLPESRRLRLTASVGLDILAGEPTDKRPNDTLRTNFVADYPFSNYNAVLELAWITDTIYGGSSHSYYVTPGFIYHVPKEYYPEFPGTVHLGLGVRFGFGDAEHDVEYLTNIKVDIPLKLKVSLHGVKLEGIIEKQWPAPDNEKQNDTQDSQDSQGVQNSQDLNK